MLLLFAVIHIILCLLVYFLIRLRILKCGSLVFMLVLMVPVWGMVCLIILEIRTRGKQQVKEEIGIEKMKVNDEIHRSILMEEDPARERVVPLEEALLLNAPALRRELMMEIMYSNPDDYVKQLQEARMNDDTEVVHYAVTALAELQSGYDLRLQEFQRRMEEEPHNDEILDQYLKLLERHIGSGLLEGSARDQQLCIYSSLLGDKLAKDGDSLRLYEKKIQADLLVGDCDQAYDEIQRVLELWPNKEAGYLFLIRYYASVKNREGITQTLALLERGRIPLSAEGRGTVRFWQDGRAKGNGA